MSTQSILQNLSEEHTIAMAQKSWGIWEAIRDIHEGNTRIKVPRFVATKARARLFNAVPVQQIRIDPAQPKKLAGALKVVEPAEVDQIAPR